METNKKSKKALRGLLTESMQESIAKLELPAPTKKISKIIQRNAKKIASMYNDVLKREEKKKKKAEKFLSDSVNGRLKRKDKIKSRKIQVAEPIRL